jgi:hypothetical protein
MEWIFYRRLFHIAHSEYKRYRLMSEIKSIIIAVLVAIMLCMMR